MIEAAFEASQGPAPVAVLPPATATATPATSFGRPDAGPHFVDLDDACRHEGPAVWDLRMLLSGDADQARQQPRTLLEALRADRRLR